MRRCYLSLVLQCVYLDHGQRSAAAAPDAHSSSAAGLGVVIALACHCPTTTRHIACFEKRPDQMR
eukprot:900210-Amphidinium_carterae.1